MKYKSILLTLLLLHVMATMAVAQDLLIKGKVIDDKNEGLIGANIQEVDNLGNGTIADFDGNFQLKVKSAKARIRISYIGYTPKVVNVIPGKQNIIVLDADNQTLDEVVVVGYGTQKRITNTGAVSMVKGDILKAVPTGNVNNTLVGRLPGIFSQQRGGQPGADQAVIYIRGTNSLNNDQQPLIIVDDVEYEYDQLAQLNANEIESVSILKDAATTAIYGLKGANGVIVVTTTRGKEGKPRINVTVEGGRNQVVQFPRFLDSYNTALLYNEAVVNDSYGSVDQPTLPFSADDLQKFKDGKDIYGHPNVNWVETLFNKHSSSGRLNIDVSGGNKIVKYYTSLGYFTQGGIMKQFDPLMSGDDADNNYYYHRINFRSNLDITPTKTTKIRFDMNGRFETQNSPNGWSINTNSIFYDVYAYSRLAPYAQPITNPDGSYGYNTHVGGEKDASPIARLANGGYTRNYKNNFNVIAGIDQKLDFITQGLSIKGNVSYAGNFNEQRQLKRNASDLPAYLYDIDNDSYTLKDPTKTKIPVYSLSQDNKAFKYTVILQGMLNYDRTFSGHHVYGLALVNQRSYVNQADLQVNYRGTTLRLGYDYEQRYLVEFNLARNGNDQFREDERYGIFPAVSVGWNVAEERFFKKLRPVVDMFKIRGSYGIVGSDASYQKVVDEKITYTTGSNFYGPTTTEGSLVNPYITWEKERKLDLGVDLNMFDNRLALTADYFYNYRYDQLIDQGDVSAIIGQGLPKKNIGETSNKGFDGQITYRDRKGDFNYSVGFNFSYAINTIEYVSEAPDYPYLARTGRHLNVPLGYHCIGFYQLEDFDESGNVKEGVAIPNWSTIQPGDLRYADLNNDGTINDADRTYADKPNLPNATFGLSLDFGYKGFSVSMLWQGAGGYAVENWRQGIDAFNSNMQEIHLDRWTPATAYTATFPRMGLNAKNNGSFQIPSDFWLVDARYLRLKQLNVSYQLPSEWLKKVCPVVSNAKVYMIGYNLLNFHNLKKYNIEPEGDRTNYSTYPMTANYTFGIQIGF
ncbi:MULTISPECIES: TonB-dependent receptor [Bacteroides]|uniref:SusC/RagA family TonB-linked outer membrane protein n=1 Tax=Bacteroides TaxID=816 RepID=UPI00319DFEF9